MTSRQSLLCRCLFLAHARRWCPLSPILIYRVNVTSEITRKVKLVHKPWFSFHEISSISMLATWLGEILTRCSVSPLVTAVLFRSFDYFPSQCKLPNPYPIYAWAGTEDQWWHFLVARSSMREGLRNVRAFPLTGCKIFCSVRLFLLFGKAGPSLLGQKLPQRTAIQRWALRQRQIFLSGIELFHVQQRVIAPHYQRSRVLSLFWD